ncbi:MAG: hypothetical protein AAF085_10640 [Planctomycetota bacterium]
MPSEHRNPVQAWLDESVERERSEEEKWSSFAETMNQPGIETEPMFACEITFDHGLVTLSDHWCVLPEEGETIKVKPGRYNVFVVGKAFGTERRIASVSLIYADCESEELDRQESGSVGGDSWGLIFGEYQQWHDALSEQEQEDLGEKQFGTYPDGCELFQLSVGDKRIEAVRSFTGWGSGTFPIDTLWDEGVCVGLVCEFIYEVAEE